MLRTCVLTVTFLLGCSIASVPPIRLELSANSVSPGEEITVKCTASSSAAPRFLTIDGQLVVDQVESDRLSVESVGPVTTWTIDPVLPEDAGVYVCAAPPQSTTDSNSLPQTLVYYFASPPSSIKVKGPFVGWSTPSAVDGEISVYQLRVSLSSGNHLIVEKSTTTYHMLSQGDAPSNLQGDSAVTVQIRAVTEKGDGEWSSEETVPVKALAVADFVPVLADLETPRLSLIHDSPVISGRNVTFHLATNVDISQLNCRLAAHSRLQLSEDLRIFHDCSSGSITYTDLVDGRYTFHAQAKTSVGEEKIAVQRKFRPDNMVECTVHLVNNGITVSGSSAIVEFDYFADYTRCRLDDESEFRDCNSPYLLTDLSPGEHFLKIVPQVCPEPFRYPLKLLFVTS